MHMNNEPLREKHWIVGEVETSQGIIPRLATRLDLLDRLGAIRVRLGVGRMSYTVNPGLYAVGSPMAESPVFVSANYKLSFDHLRSELEGIDGWIMVIDTKGVNVWCAAGKGTFGTAEIVHSIETTQLSKIVNHHTIIVPQLGAPGVSAHKVKQDSSFRVIFGPVRAHDIPQFLADNMKATPAMRRVLFTLGDRTVLIPMELVTGSPYVFGIAVALFFLAGLSKNGFAFPGWSSASNLLLLLVAYIGSCVLVPLLLPWLPGKAFSWKGALVGLVLAVLFILIGVIPYSQLKGQLEAAGWVLLMPAIGAFMAMNFTGASTYTSLSGVKREMRYAVPLQILAAALGLILWVTARFF